jgi:hypothetical protein
MSNSFIVLIKDEEYINFFPFDKISYNILKSKLKNDNINSWSVSVIKSLFNQDLSKDLNQDLSQDLNYSSNELIYGEVISTPLTWANLIFDSSEHYLSLGIFTGDSQTLNNIVKFIDARTDTITMWDSEFDNEKLKKASLNDIYWNGFESLLH